MKSAKEIFFTLLLLTSTVPYSRAGAVDINATQHKFSVTIGQTRAIYPLSSVNGISLPVINPQDYPILIHSQVVGEDKQSPAPFVITPPLFRLDGGMKGRIRVIRTEGDFQQDRESLQWLCLTGIPPKEGDVWNNDQQANTNANAKKNVNLNIELSIRTCIKLFIRPEQLKQKPEMIAGELKWKRQGRNLHVYNPTPFYLTFKSINLGDENVNLLSLEKDGKFNHIPPFSEKNYALPANNSSIPHKVYWRIINDIGAASNTFSANIM